MTHHVFSCQLITPEGWVCLFETSEAGVLVERFKHIDKRISELLAQQNVTTEIKMKIISYKKSIIKKDLALCSIFPHLLLRTV